MFKKNTTGPVSNVSPGVTRLTVEGRIVPAAQRGKRKRGKASEGKAAEGHQEKGVDERSMQDVRGEYAFNIGCESLLQDAQWTGGRGKARRKGREWIRPGKTRPKEKIGEETTEGGALTRYSSLLIRHRGFKDGMKPKCFTQQALLRGAADALREQGGFRLLWYSEVNKSSAVIDQASKEGKPHGVCAEDYRNTGRIHLTCLP